MTLYAPGIIVLSVLLAPLQLNASHTDSNPVNKQHLSTKTSASAADSYPWNKAFSSPTADAAMKEPQTPSNTQATQTSPVEETAAQRYHRVIEEAKINRPSSAPDRMGQMLQRLDAEPWNNNAPEQSTSGR